MNGLPIGLDSFLSTLTKGGQGMHPLVLMALIQGGSSLAGAGIAGLGAGAEKKKERKYREEQLEKKGLDQPYYQSPYMPGFDRVLAEAILGNLQMRMGDKLGEYGLDIDTMREGMGLKKPFQSQKVPLTKRGEGSERQLLPQISPSRLGRR